ncbi:hypothetical protein M9458_050575 [Cirrhinus mrigala]|uniref:Gypsy retrotransposon integrase-like protein 1 n=1 Tax=Cirrhinus mrigala TaxID=683832 RepID=A0ABD0MZV5_CIRMR
MSLLCYLDDLLVFGKSEQEALDRLELVFSRLREHNLKLAPKKCYFLRKSVKLLGHIITAEGIAADPAKVSAINEITAKDLMEEAGKTPSYTKVKSFLGMANYSHFIENFSRLAKPLFQLTAGQRVKHRGAKVSARPYRCLKPEDWTSDCEMSLGKLKKAISTTVILAHPDFNKPFLLFTDLSMDGLGAVLSQVIDGELKPRPVAFASKSLSRSQARYPAHRLEFFALKWAVCDKFAHWLKGARFTVLTDNNPLTYIMTKPKLDACEQRWVSKLAPFDFDLKYIPGSQNIPADLLSRESFTTGFKTIEPGCKANHMSLESVQNAFKLSVNSQEQQNVENECKDRQEVGIDEVKAVIQSSLDWDSSLPVRTAQLSQCSSHMLYGQSTLPAFTAAEIRRKQREDDVVVRVIYFLERKRRPSQREKVHETSQVLRMLKHWEKLEIKDGVLYRISKDKAGKKRYQLVVPNSLKSTVLRGTHQGQRRTLHLVRQRFFWSGMDNEVRKYVTHCKRCVLSKTPEPDARAPLESVKTCEPLELVCIDFWSAEGRNGDSVDVLVLTDHFTKLPHAFPCPNQTAKVVAQKLWNQFFCVYVFPRRIHSDQGANFESKLISELLEISGVKKSHTTPYHPMGNGQTERFNRTLGNMIRSLPTRAKVHWPQMIQTLTFAYNCTIHETTGFAPFYLMFSRVPRLPVDIMFESVLRDNEVVDYNDYVSSFQKDLKEAVRIAQDSTTQAQKKQAEQVEDPVTKKNKVVHRNFILPVNFLPIGQSDAESTVLSTLSNDGLDMEWPEKEGATLYVDEDYDDQRTAAWEVPRVDAKSKPRQDPVCSQDPPTKFFDEDLEGKTDTGEPSEQWSEHDQSEDTLSNMTPSDCTPSSISVSHCSSVGSPESVEEIDTRGGDNSVRSESGTLHTRSGRTVKPIRRLVESMSMLTAEPEELRDSCCLDADAL